MNHKFSYFLIRTLTAPLSILPIRVIHLIGKGVGLCCYHLIPNYRKRVFSNLSLASDLKLSEKEMIHIAKKAFENLAITCLEYPKFSTLQKTNAVIECENPEEAEKIISDNKGIIFFCGHQANWEVLFLEGTQRMSGVAIGRPIKNPILYRWLQRIREKFGGKIIAPRHALKEGLRALKEGKFLGIIGDQGMPESGFTSKFLGRRAWTSPAPAMLAYKTNSPIIVATTRRQKGKYIINYSPPLWPDLSKPYKSEIERLMTEMLQIFEDSVKKRPEEWLWQHNRWKQETPRNVFYRFRHDTFLIILPDDPTELLAHLETFRKIYPLAFISVLTPEAFKEKIKLSDADIIPYQSLSDILRRDYRFKFVFNLTRFNIIKTHFLKLSAFEVVNKEDLIELASKQVNRDFSDILIHAICRPQMQEALHA